MWPWGHLAFGYLLYSPLVRLWRGRPPTGGATLALGVAALFPDLLDKGLSWWLGLFPQGYSVGHSVFVAVPLGLLAVLAARARGRVAVGVAVAVGYWSHLVGDVLFALALREPHAFARVLWPLVTLPPYATEFAGTDRLLYYLARWLTYLRTVEDPTAIAIYVAPLVLALLLWLVDGAPVLADLWRAARVDRG